MAIIFDGANTLITLDSGVTELDVIDIYSEWKRWMLLGDNAKYTKAFRTIGGDPLTSIINAGAYFFLQNTDGWRIKPPEEDITIYLSGNLAPESSALPSFTETIGAFTAAILGLQPVTQGVSPAMADQLAFTSFQSIVCLDPAAGQAGTGSIGSDKIGTRRVPSNNPTDALTIAIREGLHTIQILSDTTLSAADDFSAGFEFAGDSPFIFLTINSAPNVTGCSVKNLSLVGELDGLNKIEGAEIGNITDVSGDMHDCDLDGTIGINAKMHIINCFSGRAALGFPTLTGIGTNEVIIRNMRGSICLEDMTGGAHSAGVYGGRLIIAASCTGGTIYARGEPYAIDNLSGGLVTVIDQTSSYKVSDIHGHVDRAVHVNTEELTNGNGYQQSPYNNWSDAVDYAEANGLLTLEVMADATIDRQLRNFEIRGIGNPVLDLNTQDIDGTIIERCTLTGSMIGSLNVNECALVNTQNMAGIFLTVSVAGTLTVANSADLIISRVAPALAGFPWTLDMDNGGISHVAVHNISGGMKVINMDHASDVGHFHFSQGEVVIDSTCILGELVITGVVSVIDNSGPGCTVTQVDFTHQNIDESHTRLALNPLKPLTNKDDGSISATGIDIVATPSGTDIIQTRQ
jgi:hypothetical protein